MCETIVVKFGVSMEIGNSNELEILTKLERPMMTTTLLSDWSLFSATHVGVAHFSEGYCTYKYTLLEF